jgi:hypothetical protein
MAKRFIDADNLIEHLEDNVRECGNPDVATEPITYGCSLGLKGALSYARTLPTADVVEAVRCAECKHLDIINKAPIYAKCKKHEIAFELWQDDTREHYCSWGERKDGMRMTCKDCLYFKDVCNNYLADCTEHGEGDRVFYPCTKFRNKADFVEVVRCKDCRYFDKGFINNNGFFVCSASGMEITETDFCSYGERRKDDEA